MKILILLTTLAATATANSAFAAYPMSIAAFRCTLTEEASSGTPLEAGLHIRLYSPPHEGVTDYNRIPLRVRASIHVYSEEHGYDFKSVDPVMSLADHHAGRAYEFTVDNEVLQQSYHLEVSRLQSKTRQIVFQISGAGGNRVLSGSCIFNESGSNGMP